MKKYTAFDVSEANLEDLVRQAPELIEDGLRFLDHQLPTSNGRLDVLLADSGGALVVAELKVVEDDGMLIQALDYFDHVSSNREALARVYASAKIDPTQPARLMLLAPSFSVAMLNRIKWFDLAVSLFVYRCIKIDGDSGNDVIPVYIEITPPTLVEPVPTRNFDEIVAYITDEVARSKAKEIIDALRAVGKRIAVDPVKGAISIKMDGRVLAYVWPRRRWFRFGYRSMDGQWVTVDIEGQTDLADVHAGLRASLAHVQGGA
jgi:Endonuclease NucS